MHFSIDITEEFHVSWGIIHFGLEVLGNPEMFPVYVGCSFRINDEIFDVPARWLRAPGRVLWKFENEDLQRIFQTKTGETIFAVYSDDTFAERLADTGWREWFAIGCDPMGSAKIHSHMNSRYKNSANQWLTSDEIQENRQLKGLQVNTPKQIVTRQSRHDPIGILDEND